jgi:hypothetical protein
MSILNDLELLETEIEAHHARAELLRRWRRIEPTSVRLSLDLLPSVNRTFDADIVEQATRDLAGSFLENHLVIFMGAGMSPSEGSMWSDDALIVDACNYRAIAEFRTPETYWGALGEAGTYVPTLGHYTFTPTLFLNAAHGEQSNVLALLKEDPEPEDSRATLEAELKSIFDRLSDMKKIEDVDDEYNLKPTPRAHSDMKVAIIDAHDRMGEKFPLPRLVPDGDGGIVAVWMKGEKRVRLRIRADKEARDYLYHQSVDEYDVEPVTNENLTKRLEWLLSE